MIGTKSIIMQSIDYICDATGRVKTKQRNWRLLMLIKAASTICFGRIKTLSKRKIRHNNNCNTPKVNPGLTSLLPLRVPDSNLTLSVLYSSLEKNKWRTDYRVAEVGTFNSPLPRWKLHLIILSHCWSERNIRWGNWLLSATWNGQQPAWWSPGVSNVASLSARQYRHSSCPFLMLY